MPEIAIYTTRFCPYCHAAKELLTRKGVEFTWAELLGQGSALVTALNASLQIVPQTAASSGRASRIWTADAVAVMVDIFLTP